MSPLVDLVATHINTLVDELIDLRREVFIAELRMQAEESSDDDDYPKDEQSDDDDNDEEISAAEKAYNELKKRFSDKKAHLNKIRTEFLEKFPEAIKVVETTFENDDDDDHNPDDENWFCD